MTVTSSAILESEKNAIKTINHIIGAEGDLRALFIALKIGIEHITRRKREMPERVAVGPLSLQTGKYASTHIAGAPMERISPIALKRIAFLLSAIFLTDLYAFSHLGNSLCYSVL